MCSELLSEPKRRDSLGDLGVDESIILKGIKEKGVRVWSGFWRLRIMSSGRLL
jgi:hypothetical protein